jgi:hypothetical protein
MEVGGAVHTRAQAAVAEIESAAAALATACAACGRSRVAARGTRRVQTNAGEHAECYGNEPSPHVNLLGRPEKLLVSADAMFSGRVKRQTMARGRLCADDDRSVASNELPIHRRLADSLQRGVHRRKWFAPKESLVGRKRRWMCRFDDRMFFRVDQRLFFLCQQA